MQSAALQIISYSGEAKSHFVEAIREGRSGNYLIAILLGPQVKLMKKAAENTAAPYGIPVDVIDLKSYGTSRNRGKNLGYLKKTRCR
ncbi:hypothetical protein AS888_16350 [Peribacillus simplex]|uniref:Uncharacterized protein n=1 Tax=Peribacillus simplex TaxID=1478 RepID=A0A109N0D7_9BACI|nr:PTS lactose/cellobiose transporter subunit IIA [Peribacillus simplex]KWW21176.1 hypothetical protein AS888_16350 [Peribacillus simplex]